MSKVDPRKMKKHTLKNLILTSFLQVVTIKSMIKRSFLIMAKFIMINNVVVNKDIEKNAVHSIAPTSGTQFLLM